MSRNIGIWELIGFIVACCWVVIGIALGPSYNLGHSTLVLITCHYRKLRPDTQTSIDQVMQCQRSCVN